MLLSFSLTLGSRTYRHPVKWRLLAAFQEEKKQRRCICKKHSGCVIAQKIAHIIATVPVNIARFCFSERRLIYYSKQGNYKRRSSHVHDHCLRAEWCIYLFAFKLLLFRCSIEIDSKVHRLNFLLRAFVLALYPQTTRERQAGDRHMRKIVAYYHYYSQIYFGKKSARCHFSYFACNGGNARSADTEVLLQGAMVYGC